MYEAITGLGLHLSHFHVSESHRGTSGTGTVDWASSFRALRDIGYDNWLVIEAFGPDVAGIPEAIHIWRDCYRDKEDMYRKGMKLIQEHIRV